MPREADFEKLISTLIEAKVDFIVVGGVSAVLQGAPISTFDLDIVHSRSAQNVNRLLQVLGKLQARYRGQGERVLFPDETHLKSPGHQLLITSLGPMDLLGTIGQKQGYEDLIDQTIQMELTPGNKFYVLNLETLIKIKEEIGREKDKAVLDVLRSRLQERKRSN